ncbi:MAG TPA: amidase family protein [Candidatus Sulfotelmatobacter sp.]|nr:amidase family protein [Candidatus Sulfotelmatobacter sp.]
MTEIRGLSRREFLALASASAAAAAAGCRSQKAVTARKEVSTSELVELSAMDVVAKLQKGEVTAERYAEALLERCQQGAALNVFITLPHEQVLEAARAADRLRSSGAKLGPLHGLPIPVKDSVNTKDMPTTGGTPALRHFRPKEDAPIVRTLLAAGAIVLGKTNLHELSMGWTSNNLAFGPVHNPYDVKRIPGGSSGGTAAAVAARMAPLGVAEDTEGSIRVPAAMCGIAGFRPTTTRYVSTGVIPITPLFDQVGPHARTVGDLVLFDSLAAGDWSPLPTTELKGTKLGVARSYFFSDLDSEVERVANEALRKLQSAGVELVEAEVPDLAQLVKLTTDPIMNHDLRYALKKYLQEYKAGVTLDQLIAQASADIRQDFCDLSPGGKYFVGDAAYQAARDVHLLKLRQTYREYFARTGVAAIVFPTTMIPPTPIGEDVEVTIGGKKVPFDTAVGRNIAPGSTAGLPGLVLPAGMTTGGLPVALEFDGLAGSDRSLLALGLSVEHVLGEVPAPEL